MGTRKSTDKRWENQIYGHCGVNQGDRLRATVHFLAEKQETLKNTFTAKTQPKIGKIKVFFLTLTSQRNQEP